MTKTLCLRNRQRICAVDVPLLRRILQHLIETQFHLQEYELCIHLMAAPAMARINWQFLRHEGSTDVLTFDYGEGRKHKNAVGHLQSRPRSVMRANAWLGCGPSLRGEIFVCLDDAVIQARQFRATWQSELVRYAIHGLLHLRGYDDLSPTARRGMKREENRLLKIAASHFDIGALRKTNSKRRSQNETRRTA
jgi:probable rRNA maturation factor